LEHDQFLIKKESEIVTIPVTKEMLILAKEKADEMGCLKHSMMKGERNVEGILGELGALKFLTNAVGTASYQHDLKIGQITIEVKTKRLTNKPRLDYDCTVYSYNTEQDCHIYLFAGVNPEHTLVWLNGFISKDNFYKKAEFLPAGSERPLSNGKTLIYKRDNYVVKVNQLNKIDILKKIVLNK
jgi:hypothetical protein